MDLVTFLQEEIGLVESEDLLTEEWFKKIFTFIFSVKICETSNPAFLINKDAIREFFKDLLTKCKSKSIKAKIFINLIHFVQSLSEETEDVADFAKLFCEEVGDDFCFKDQDIENKFLIFEFFVKYSSLDNTNLKAFLSDLTSFDVTLTEPSPKFKRLLKSSEVVSKLGKESIVEFLVNAIIRLQTKVEVGDDRETEQMLMLAIAKSLDYRLNFSEACRRYLEVSAFRSEYFNNAVLCAILSSPSSQKSLFLSNLIRDGRFNSLEAPVISMVKLIDSGKLVSLNDKIVADFSRVLKPHQRGSNCQLEESLPILHRTLIQNNLIVVSGLYTSVSIDSLARYFGTTRNCVKAIARQMICNGQLGAKLDQIDDCLILRHDDKTGSGDGKSALFHESSVHNSILKHVEKVIEDIARSNPDWFLKTIKEIKASYEPM